MSIQNIKSGFRKCGIHPFDPNAIDKGQLFRNKLIPNENIDLSVPPEDVDTTLTDNGSNPVGDPVTPTLVEDHSNSVDYATLDFIVAGDDDMNERALLGIDLDNLQCENENLSDYHFVAEVGSSEIVEKPLVLNLDSNPGNRMIIQVKTGLSNTIPEYQFGPNESIDVSVEEPVCCCGLPRTPSIQENPLVAAGLVSPDLAKVFAPPDEKIPAGRKRPLHVQ